MPNERRIYTLELNRNDLSKKYSIDKNVWKRRHDDLLEFLSEFMNIQEIQKDNGRYVYEIEGEMPDEIPRLPRKSQMEDKQRAYAKFTYEALGTEFKPNSKSKIARDALWNFGRQEFHHNSVRAVTNRFIKEPFDKYGETNGVFQWVDCSDYSLLSDEDLSLWKKILVEERIDETSAANAFYRMSQGEDVSKEMGYFERARQRMLEATGIIPVNVRSWRRKKTES